MLVSDYMKANPLTVTGRTPVEYAAGLMRRHQVFQLPVIDESGHLVGIVTDRDIRSAAGNDDRLMVNLVVSEIMTTDVITVSPADDLRIALDLLWRQRIGGLPVVQKDVVVGIITVRDMLRCLRDQFEMPSIIQEAKGSRALADIF